MELDFSISNEWQGLSDQEKQQHLLISKRVYWMLFLSAESSQKSNMT